MVGVVRGQNTQSVGTLWDEEEFFQFKGSQRYLGCKGILKGGLLGASVHQRGGVREGVRSSVA